MRQSEHKKLQDCVNILSEVKYKDGWSFDIEEGVGGFILTVNTPFMHNAPVKEWYVSSFSTDTEVVRTAYKAVMHIESWVLGETALFAQDFNPFNVGGAQSLVNYVANKFAYKNWRLRCETRGNYAIVQIVFDAPDTSNPDIVEEQHCRKFLYRLDTGTASELVDTVNYAVKIAEEHECNEMFLYRGKQVYNPHIDMKAMVNFIEANEFDHR